MARIAFIAPYASYYVNFSWDLLKTLVHDGHEVIAIAPDKDNESKFKSIGVHYRKEPLINTGINPFYDIYSICILIRLLKRIEPDTVACFSIKPVLYGSIAARITKIEDVYLTITGLGYVFIGNTLKQRILLPLIKALYKVAIKNSKKVFFQNPDDLLLFESWKLLTRDNKALIINGSGVNIDEFSFISSKGEQISFILIARLIKDKGIEEFIEASRILKRKYPLLNCKVLGPFDRNPTSISKEKVKQWVSEGIIEYLGETSDVRPYLSQSSVFVLPSYREGTPKSVLEAMSMGLPVITTDSPGCRETVTHQENGFLVPIKDSKALADAMEKFVLNPSLVSIMGYKSREIVVQKYDVRKVNEFMKDNMGLA
ncbi:MAG TPA: glycosyltransferase family 4 protein [Niallia sp.]|nr:glycosyltransferase family 4 protein [Niallia sp.]